MSIILNMLAQVPEMAANEPNWMIIGILVGIFVFLAIILLIPSKPKELPEESEVKEPLEDKASKHKVLSDDSEEKPHLSLSEIKGAKRASVSDNKSKDEMRELRKERRAATQTANAIHEREEASKRQEETDEPEAAEQVAEAVPEAEPAPVLEPSEEAAKEPSAEEKLASPIDDILTNSDAGASDVYTSLFGNSGAGMGSLNLDDIVSETPNVSDNSIFPTLGSKLIPLNELMAAADEKEEPITNPLDELTKKFADKAEKKTLN